MFCPQCRCEFQVGFTRCNDCDVELVERLEAEPGEPNAPGYVVIATVTGPVEDSQICSFLEANGIPTQVRGDSRKSTLHSPGSFARRSSQLYLQVPGSSRHLPE